MFKIGDFNELEIIKEVSFGVYLGSEEEKVLLPQKYVRSNFKIGDKINVFIYKDSEDRLIATTLEPFAKVGDFAYLKVKDVNNAGAFLDWGLDKDLLVPYSEQKVKMEVGKKYIVKVYLDRLTDRIFASAKITKYIDNEPMDIKEGQEVDLLVYKHVDIGETVIINNRYLGMLYKSDIYQKISIGNKFKGYIAKIREDNKIDVSLRKKGYQEVIDSKDKIMMKLEEYDGFLPLTDKSSPQLIEKHLQMSKSVFKKAIGGLYKERKIEITENGVKLI